MPVKRAYSRTWQLTSVLLAGLLAACVARPVPVTHELEPLLMTARNGWAGLTSWRAFVKLSGHRSGEGFSGQLAMVLEPQDRLYFEAVLPFGKTGPVVGLTDHELRIVWPNEKLHFVDTADPDTLRRLIGMAVVPVELRALLAGYAIPWSLYTLQTQRTLDPVRSEVKLSSPKLNRSATVVFDHRQGGIQGAEVLKLDGSLAYRITYSKFELVDGFAMPEQIDFVAPEMDIRARPRKVTINAAPSAASLFRPEITADSQLVAFDDQQGPWLMPGTEQ